MNWTDRVNNTISLISPSGQSFEAVWIGNKRTTKKKLGVMEYPGVRGAELQDMGTGADEYPLTFYFEGPDHDITAAHFFEACHERGVWDVLHPVRGQKNLQLVTVTEDIAPVTSGNITEIDSEWLEVGINNPAASIAALEADVADQLDVVAASSKAQAKKNIQISKPTLLGKLIAAVQKVMAIIDRVKSTIANIMATIAAIRAAIIAIVTGIVNNVVAMISLVRSLIALPGQLIKDIRERFAYFEKIIDDALGIAPKSPTLGGVNEAAIQELVLTTCVAGMAEALLDTEFTTREEALHYLERIQGAFDGIMGQMDAVQAMYANSDIDMQYFSQSDSFYDLMELMRRVRELMLRRSFDLSAAKRITLVRERAPIEIALTEGVDFDVFIASNKLRGDEILLLPTGRQVVVYL